MAKRSDTLWPTLAVIQSVAGKIRIPNDIDYPIVVKRNEHLAQVSPVFNLSTTYNISHSAPSKFEQPVKPTSNHQNVTIDPDNNILPPTVVSSFKKINEEFTYVFRPDFKGYMEQWDLYRCRQYGPCRTSTKKG